jgi:hypothetical protein
MPITIGQEERERVEKSLIEDGDSKNSYEREIDSLSSQQTNIVSQLEHLVGKDKAYDAIWNFFIGDNQSDPGIIGDYWNLFRAINDFEYAVVKHNVTFDFPPDPTVSVSWPYLLPDLSAIDTTNLPAGDVKTHLAVLELIAYDYADHMTAWGPYQVGAVAHSSSLPPKTSWFDGAFDHAAYDPVWEIGPSVTWDFTSEGNDPAPGVFIEKSLAAAKKVLESGLDAGGQAELIAELGTFFTQGNLDAASSIIDLIVARIPEDDHDQKETNLQDLKTLVDSMDPATLATNGITWHDDLNTKLDVIAVDMRWFLERFFFFFYKKAGPAGSFLSSIVSLCSRYNELELEKAELLKASEFVDLYFDAPTP